MKSVTAYLNFDGTCRQAMMFYQECLGANLQLSPFADKDGKPSTEPDARIMHSELSRGGEPLLMASDTPPGMVLSPGNNISIGILCDSVDEIERLFTAFGKNGQVRMPLANMPWGGRFGMLTDQFGIQWLFNCQLVG